MEIVSKWKKTIGLLFALVLAAAFLPLFSAPAQAAVVGDGPALAVAAPTPQPPPQFRKTVTGVVRSGGAELRATPQGAVRETLTTGAALTVVGRSADGAWLLATSLDGVTGWVERARVVLFDFDLVPVVELPATEESAAPAASAQTTQYPIPNTSHTPTPTGLTGKLALATADGSIVLYDLSTGALRTLTVGFDPAISPDGSKVAFLRCGRGVFVIDADGSNERRLYGGDGLRAPAWSPDGQSIVFSRVSGQEVCRDVGYGCLPDSPTLAEYPLVSTDLRNLSRVGLDGNGFRDIPAQKTATAPSWTANGIVYQSSDGLQITQDGPSHDKNGNPVNRQVTKLFIHRDPSWRPDGWLIAFVDDRPSHREIYTIDPNGKGLTALTRPASALIKTFPHNVAPVWSPDGQQIAFLSNRDGDWAVFVMNADGSNQRRLPAAVPMDYRFQNEQAISWGR